MRAMDRLLDVAVLIALAAPASATAQASQDTIYFPATNRIAIRHLPSVPAIDVAPGIHVHTVVGATGSVSFGAFDSGTVSPPHHHTREQVDVGLSKDPFELAIGSNVESLGFGAGVILPANVQHSIVNKGPSQRALIEFHTVRRPDMVPPRPTMTFPSAAEPVAVPAGSRLIEPIDAGGGRTLTGKTCTLRWRRVTGLVDLHPDATPTELYIYVARGSMQLLADGRTSSLGPGTVAIIPAATRHVRVSSAGGGADVVEFSVLAP